jgi:nucleoside-diphosphate-sugar epimerase
MGDSKPTVIVTGVSGDLGIRLLPFLSEYETIGVDLAAPVFGPAIPFISLDLSKEESCVDLTSLIQAIKPVGIVHLGFIDANPDDESFDLDRMWHNNVAGTARVMEAITEANRDVHIVEKFIYPSSTLVYGASLPEPVNEDAALAAEAFPYALQQMEADRVVQQRAPALRGCSVFMLRPQILAGPGIHNYVLEAFRGIPKGTGKRAQRLREKGVRLNYPLPFGDHYVQHRKQFLHGDDLMRLIVCILNRTEPESQRLTLLNVAGRGDPLTMGQCVQMAQAKLMRVPGKWGLQKLLEYREKAGIASIPAEFAAYLIGQSLLNTDRLRKFLGVNYENVIRHTNSEAFSESFAALTTQPAQEVMAGK